MLPNTFFIYLNFNASFFSFVVVVFQLLSHARLCWPHGLQHPSLLCPSLSPGVCSDSWLWSQWCLPNISSRFILFSSCLQSFPVAESFLMSWLFASGGQSIEASVSASVLPKNVQDWFPLGLTGLIFQTKGLSRVFPSTTFWKHQFFGAQPFLWYCIIWNQDLEMKFLRQRKRECNVLRKTLAEVFEKPNTLMGQYNNWQKMPEICFLFIIFDLRENWKLCQSIFILVKDHCSSF